MTAYDHRRDGCATWTGNVLTMAEVGRLNEAKTADRALGASPEVFRDLLCTVYDKENRAGILKECYERTLEEFRLYRQGIIAGRDVCHCHLKTWDKCPVQKLREAREAKP